MKMKLHTTFTFMRYESVQRVVLALAQSGFYMTVDKDGGVYTVEAYVISNDE